MNSQFTAIHKLCLDENERKNMKQFKKLIADKKFKINARDNLKFTPLMCASFSGNLKMVKKLLTLKGVQINSRSRNGKTALIMAATRGHLDVVKELLHNNANPNIKQFKNSKKPCQPKSALNVSLQCHHKKVSRYLKSRKAKKSDKRYTHWKP